MPERIASRVLVLAAIVAPVTIAFASGTMLGGCRRSAPQVPQEVVVARAPTLPEDPLDPLWSRSPERIVHLMPQDLVEPRLLRPSTSEIRVRALTDGRRLGLLLRWTDRTRDDLPGAARFVDACAVQFPAAAGADVPAPQMGEPGRSVEATLWRASWQAVVDGRGDSIRELYPDAAIDHYPFEAPALEPGSPAAKEMASLYAPARVLSHRMEGPRASAVEDLVAEGPGTLAPAARQESRGKGRWTRDGWAVAIVRGIPAGFDGDPPSQVAFAIWEGSAEEAGARKMRSEWVPLVPQPAP